jgi:energy-coupling factor transport system permease protein
VLRRTDRPCLGEPAGPRRGAPLGRLPRALHPVAWWVWALGLMVAASRTTDPILLLSILGVLVVVVEARRQAAAWAGAFAAALRLGGVVVILRTLLEVLLAAPMGIHAVITLPEVPLPSWMAGVRLGGLVTWESVVAGLLEGLRLAVIICCAGAANSLAAPSRLLRAVPAALYEVGVAVVVALTFAPNMLNDARRIRIARRLRGYEESALMAFARSGGPVLEGGLERSIRLAEAMDSRGYGRRGALTAGQRRRQSGLILAGFAGALIGLYGLLDVSAPSVLGWPMVAVGAGLGVLGLRAAGRGSPRSRYRPDPWRWEEWATGASGMGAAMAFALSGSSALRFQATPLEWPSTPTGPLIAVLFAVGSAYWSPPVPRSVRR